MFDKVFLFAGNTEFKRYFWAGSLTFAVDLSILLILTEVAGINYLWSNLISVCCGILVSYLLCIKWVFNKRRYSSVSFEFPAFVVTCIIGIFLNEFLLWISVEKINFHYLAAKVLVTLFIFVFNYLLKKILIF